MAKDQDDRVEEENRANGGQVNGATAGRNSQGPGEESEAGGAVPAAASSPSPLICTATGDVAARAHSKEREEGGSGKEHSATPSLAPHSEEREEEGAGKEHSATPSLAPDTSPCVCADAGTPLYVAAEAVACEKLAAASRLLGVPNAGQEGGATTANLQPPSPSEVGALR